MGKIITYHLGPPGIRWISTNFILKRFLELWQGYFHALLPHRARKSAGPKVKNIKKNNYFGLSVEYIFGLHEDIANTLLLDLFRTSPMAPK